MGGRGQPRDTAHQMPALVPATTHMHVPAGVLHIIRAEDGAKSPMHRWGVKHLLQRLDLLHATVPGPSAGGVEVWGWGRVSGDGRCLGVEGGVEFGWQIADRERKKAVRGERAQLLLAQRRAGLGSTSSDRQPLRVLAHGSRPESLRGSRAGTGKQCGTRGLVGVGAWLGLLDGGEVAVEGRNAWRDAGRRHPLER